MIFHKIAIVFGKKFENLTKFFTNFRKSFCNICTKISVFGAFCDPLGHFKPHLFEAFLDFIDILMKK